MAKKKKHITDDSDLFEKYLTPDELQKYADDFAYMQYLTGKRKEQAKEDLLGTGKKILINTRAGLCYDYSVVAWKKATETYKMKITLYLQKMIKQGKREILMGNGDTKCGLKSCEFLTWNEYTSQAALFEHHYIKGKRK